jgi:putative addiction module CopG family antidote
MATIPLELPVDLQDFVDSKIQSGQFGSANEYIVALVGAARRGRSSIEAALVEGLESGPAEEWTSQEWVEIRQRVIQRHQEG